MLLLRSFAAGSVKLNKKYKQTDRRAKNQAFLRSERPPPKTMLKLLFFSGQFTAFLFACNIFCVFFFYACRFLAELAPKVCHVLLTVWLSHEDSPPLGRVCHFKVLRRIFLETNKLTEIKNNCIKNYYYSLLLGGGLLFLLPSFLSHIVSAHFSEEIPRII